MADKIRLSCLIGVLLVSTVDLRWMSHGHPVPPRKDFASFPFQLAEWSGTDLVLSPGTVRVLAADNYLLRSYRNRVSGAEVELFVVYYSAQRSGDALHSPRNCLPGAGWEPVSSGFLEISNPTPAGSLKMACGRTYCIGTKRMGVSSPVNISARFISPGTELPGVVPTEPLSGSRPCMPPGTLERCL